MRATVRSVTIDCRDPYQLAMFWVQVLGTSLHPDDQPGDPEAIVSIGQDSPVLLFERVPEAKSVKN